jgi:hypothetical protein
MRLVVDFAFDEADGLRGLGGVVPIVEFLQRGVNVL